MFFFRGTAPEPARTIVVSKPGADLAHLRDVNCGGSPAGGQQPAVPLLSSAARPWSGRRNSRRFARGSLLASAAAKPRDSRASTGTQCALGEASRPHDATARDLVAITVRRFECRRLPRAVRDRGCSRAPQPGRRPAAPRDATAGHPVAITAAFARAVPIGSRARRAGAARSRSARLRGMACRKWAAAPVALRPCTCFRAPQRDAGERPARRAVPPRRPEPGGDHRSPRE